VALDSNYAAKKVYTRLTADVTLVSLLGGAASVYRGSGPGVGYPYIVIGVQRVYERDGPIRSGPNTHTETPLVLRTSIWDHGEHFGNIETIAARLDELLDGYVVQGLNGEVFICTRGTDQERDTSDPNNPVVGWDIFWNIAAKAP
jgi:hypothetical protein